MANDHSSNDWEVQPSHYQDFLNQVRDLLEKIAAEDASLLSPIRRQELVDALRQLE